MTDTFQSRREWKYRVPSETAAELSDALRARMEPDVHGVDGVYPVRSVYYDTPDLRFYHERKDGLKVRRKLRVRNYGDEVCFLEIKRKINRKVIKERVGIDRGRVLGALDGVDPAVMMAGRPESDRIALERFRFNLRSLGLIPTVAIDYRRRAWVASDAGLRITLDCELRCQPRPGPETLFDHEDLSPFEERCVFEIKFDARPPHWLLMLVSEFRLRREAYSKYCESIDWCNATPAMEAAESQGVAARA